MKASKEQVARLREECMARLAELGVPPGHVRTEKNRWDLVAATGASAWLYKAGLTDDHIASAMRAIFPPVSNQTE
jgi:hypothetical protein